MPPQLRNVIRGKVNNATGAAWERAISWEAARADVLAVRNGQTVKWLPGGRTVVQRSNLDWTFVRRDHAPLFVDAKSFQGRRFGQSMLDPHQVALVARYLAHGALAGFLVYLREINVVAYYGGHLLSAPALRRGFGAEDGLVLGRLQAFDVAKIWGD